MRCFRCVREVYYIKRGAPKARLFILKEGARRRRACGAPLNVPEFPVKITLPEGAPRAKLGGLRMEMSFLGGHQTAISRGTEV